MSSESFISFLLLEGGLFTMFGFFNIIPIYFKILACYYYFFFFLETLAGLFRLSGSRDLVTNVLIFLISGHAKIRSSYDKTTIG